MSYKLFKLTLLICISLSLYGDECECPCKIFRAEYGYAFGEFIGVDRSYQEMGFFAAPYHTENAAWFVDGRAYFFDDYRWGASAGTGYRKAFSHNRVFGANIYYDYLEGFIKTFHEIGLGLEWLSPCWDFRINGYHHIDPNRKGAGRNNFNYGDGYEASCDQVEYSFDRIDMEVGRRFCYCPCGTWLYVGAGPYYLYSRLDEVFGGFFRATVSWRDIVSLEGRVSYDDMYKTRVQGRVLISIPLAKLCEWGSCCRDILTEPVRRNGVMFTDQCCDWEWNW